MFYGVLLIVLGRQRKAPVHWTCKCPHRSFAIIRSGENLSGFFGNVSAAAIRRCQVVFKQSSVPHCSTRRTALLIGATVHLNTESSPCLRGEPSVRDGHRVLWSGCRRGRRFVE